MATSSKVMLVEDDVTMRAVLRTLLEIEGYQVALTQANQQIDGLIQSIRDEKPDVLLLDVHLRDISGLDVITRIRADSGISGVRVIMTSGMDVKDRCMSAGADDFLLKPYMPDELMQKLLGIGK
jgi:DNA-binding response OmpR family regulator